MIGKPRIVLAIFLIAVTATLALSGRARAMVVHLWPGERFDQCTQDPRIFCEPGSEPFARRIAPLLPSALALVEQKQQGSFLRPVKIYTYQHENTYALYSGTRRGVGVMSFGEVHLAPAMQAVPGQHPALLAHELSHLHLQQRVGTFGMVRLPNWFLEGWATHVSGGGGAGDVTPEQAIFALVHGRHFQPGDTESLFSPSNAEHFKLNGMMYYRQASLLVDYLQRRDPAAFTRLTANIEAGNAFDPALRSAYGVPLSILWHDFLNAARQHSAAQWPHG